MSRLRFHPTEVYFPIHQSLDLLVLGGYSAEKDQSEISELLLGVAITVNASDPLSSKFAPVTTVRVKSSQENLELLRSRLKQCMSAYTESDFAGPSHIPSFWEMKVLTAFLRPNFIVTDPSASLLLTISSPEGARGRGLHFGFVLLFTEFESFCDHRRWTDCMTAAEFSSLANKPAGGYPTTPPVSLTDAQKKAAEEDEEMWLQILRNFSK